MKLYSHTVQAIVGSILAVGLMFVSTKYTEWRRDAEPVENWVEMRSIYVPDFAIGEEDKAVAVFDIRRKEPFTYQWTVTGKPLVENREFLCFASGHRENIPGDELPTSGVPLKQIFGDRPCPWYPGEFKFLVAWEIHRDGYNVKTANWESNVFRVLPEGAMSYVPQEQIQQLEEVKGKIEQLEEVVK